MKLGAYKQPYSTLATLVFHTAAKDTRINVRLHGVLDVPLNLGGGNKLNRWPQNPSWQLVAVGRGHGVDDF